jgi:succinyl-diaminopimelate desuccinylase
MTDQSDEQRALARIDIQSIIADTCDLIRGRGENPGGTEAETVRRLRRISKRIGARVRTQQFAPGRENLRAVLGPEDGPSILFLGHSDVVPAGDGWSADPFEPVVGDGMIIGRGATDMKGGLAAVIAAMEAVHEVAPWLRLELLCTGDEEDLTLGVQAALAADHPRDYLACIVAEPTDLAIVIGCRGAANFTVECVGASAHAGHPEDGISSIYAASKVIDWVSDQHLELATQPKDELIGGPTWSVGVISGGSGTSMVPRQTALTIDRRTMPGEQPPEILEALLAGVRAEVRGQVDMVMPGFLTRPDAELPTVAAQVMTELGYSDELTGWSAACEGGFIADFHGTATIILGPGDVKNQAHQPDEHVRIEQLEVAARAYVLIALRLAAQMHNEHNEREEV